MNLNLKINSEIVDFISVEKAMDIVDKLDFSMINDKLMAEDHIFWDEQTLSQVEELYKKFLVLHMLYPNVDLVPTVQIDSYWHQHILDTRKYMDDCNTIFGSYLHHDPYFGIYGDKDKQANLKAFERTKSLWLSTFNENLLGLSNPCKSTDCR